LTLAGAQRLLEGAQKKAVAMNLKVNIAVVDDGGHMIAFERMDGARPASAFTATTKAITAATLRAPTGPLPPGATAPDLFLNLSLQNAALASGGKLTTLPGGVPVTVEGQIIGGVGVGGGTGEQDATIARAGIEAFEAALKTPAEAPKEAPPAEK
jgi:glc operon protein GlcG